MTTNQIDPTQVRSTYTGKAHTCMCGCAGTYRYRTATAVAAGRARGYDVTADEISDRTVTATVNKLNRLPAWHAPLSLEADGYRHQDGAIFYANVGTRTWVAYLNN